MGGVPRQRHGGRYPGAAVGARLSLGRPLDRLYGALFLALFGGIALLTYSLLAPDWRRTLLRAWLWWPLPLALLEAWR